MPKCIATTPYIIVFKSGHEDSVPHTFKNQATSMRAFLLFQSPIHGVVRGARSVCVLDPESLGWSQEAYPLYLWRYSIDFYLIAPSLMCSALLKP